MCARGPRRVSRRRSTRRLRPRRTSRRKQWRHRRAPRQHALRPLRRAGPAARPRAPRLTHRSRRLVVGLRLTARAERVGVGVGARRALLALLLLVAVAAVGYVAGHGLGSRGSSSTSTRTVLVNGVLIDFPSGWKRASGKPPIAGLVLAHELTLIPSGRDVRAGLTAGSLAADDPGPLPEGLLAQLRSNPHTDVVNLSEVQAYRYSHVDVAGFNRALTVFAIPSAAPGSTVLACYASTSDSPFARACGQVVDAVSRVGQPLGYDLTPVSAYARSLA